MNGIPDSSATVAAAQAPQASAGNEGRTGRRRRAAGYAVAAAALAVAAALVSGPPDDGIPLDPRSSGPSGLAAVVDLMRELEVHVDISVDVPLDTSTTMFVPRDLVNSERREAILSWVDRGGTLVVAGADARLHGLTGVGGGAADLFGPTSVSPECEFVATDRVASVHHDAWQGLAVPDATPDAVACFPVGSEAAWLVASARGAGTVIALGSAEPFTNRYLGDEDNAVLAAALLGPAPGDRLVVIPRPPVGEGDVGVADLVPAGFWRAFSLLVGAIVLAVLWRARRLGPPVAERLPPVLPSAELAHSVADLLHRVGDRGSAAARLRADARSTACHGLRVPMTIGDGELIDVLVRRTGVGTQDARLAVVPGPVDDDATLLHIAGACARVRAAVRRPPASHTSQDRGAHP